MLAGRRNKNRRERKKKKPGSKLPEQDRTKPGERGTLKGIQPNVESVFRGNNWHDEEEECVFGELSSLLLQRHKLASQRVRGRPDQAVACLCSSLRALMFVLRIKIRIYCVIWRFRHSIFTVFFVVVVVVDESKSSNYFVQELPRLVR